MIEIRITEAAARSITEQADYYLELSDASLAARWESAVSEAVLSLPKFPERGAPCRFRSRSLTGLRWIFVPGFPKHMIFYRYQPQERLILIVKVIHGARNLEAILDDDQNN